MYANLIFVANRSNRYDGRRSRRGADITVGTPALLRPHGHCNPGTSIAKVWVGGKTRKEAANATSK